MARRILTVACALSALSVAAHADHIPGHDNDDPTFPVPLPDREFFSGGAVHGTFIGPYDGTVILNTVYDITYVSDGATPASDLLIEITVPVNGDYAELSVTGADLGFGSGPGTFHGTLTTPVFNGVVDGHPIFGSISIIDVAIQAISGGVDGTGYFVDSYVTFDVVPVTPPCPADLNGDRAIGLSDLAILLSNFGRNGDAAPGDGDLNGDANVDLTDLAELLRDFGAPCP